MLYFNWFLIGFSLILFSTFNKFVNANEGEKEKQSEEPGDPLQAFKAQYTKLFKNMRKQHLEAVKQIQKFNDVDKQNQMMKMLMTKSQETLNEARELFSKYNSIDEILIKSLNDEKVRNTLSLVLENTAFHGDMALNFPDVYHKFYDNNQAIQDILKWSVKFSNESTLYDPMSYKMLNLMAQELDIIPKASDYTNPNASVNAKKIKNKRPKETEKSKKKEKRKRGPGMSSKSEL